MTVPGVEQRLKALKSLKVHSQSGRPQVISHKAFRKAFANDPCQEMTRLAQKKRISVSTVSRMVKKMGRKSLRRSRKPLLSAAWFRSVWRREAVCWITSRITGIESSFYFKENCHRWFCLQKMEWSGCNVWE